LRAVVSFMRSSSEVNHTMFGERCKRRVLSNASHRWFGETPVAGPCGDPFTSKPRPNPKRPRSRSMIEWPQNSSEGFNYPT
jgi:hypothetical protein